MRNPDSNNSINDFTENFNGVTLDKEIVIPRLWIFLKVNTEY